MAHSSSVTSAAACCSGVTGTGERGGGRGGRDDGEMDRLGWDRVGDTEVARMEGTRSNDADLSRVVEEALDEGTTDAGGEDDDGGGEGECKVRREAGGGLR